MDAVILLLLFVSSFVTQTVYSQDVDIRGIGDKVNAEGSGQLRTIHSSRQRGHWPFGKRLSLFETPAMMATPRGFDLYPQRQPQQPLQLLPESRYPYLLSIELERGQSMLPVQPEELQARRNLMYTFEPQAEFVINSAEQQQRQQQQQAANALAGQRFLKLISGESNAAAGNEDSADEKNSVVEQNSAERAQTQEGSQQQQQQRLPQTPISVSTRSGRPNTLNLPRAYISTLLYGRQGASQMPTFGGYNKKAESKDVFMHFGRK